MGKESFRFIHASDFHLERSMQDLLDIPDHLKNGLVDAPWKAAEAVFEHAMVEQVDFVLLTAISSIRLPRGLRGPAFLVEQFEQLAKRNIPVFWIGGHTDDPDRWPERYLFPPAFISFQNDKWKRPSFDGMGTRWYDLGTQLRRSRVDTRRRIQSRSGRQFV